MSTLYAIIVVLVATGMLIGYYLGWSGGRKEGYRQGFADGKHQGAVRGYAVGFDRGKHQRESEQKEAATQPIEKRPLGCALLVIGTVGALGLLSLAIGTG